jgi:hypothetical protein
MSQLIVLRNIFIGIGLLLATTVNAQEREDLIIMNNEHFRIHIVRPTIKLMDGYIKGMWSEAAENLLVGTAIMESDLAYLKQKNGPALGVYQIEPFTHKDITERYIEESKFRDEFNNMFDNMVGWPYPDEFDINQLIFDLRYATMIARIKYWMSVEPLPSANDIHALGHYWNKNYNANPDVGTAEQFESKYRKAHNL